MEILTYDCPLLRPVLGPWLPGNPGLSPAALCAKQYPKTYMYDMQLPAPTVVLRHTMTSPKSLQRQLMHTGCLSWCAAGSQVGVKVTLLAKTHALVVQQRIAMTMPT